MRALIALLALTIVPAAFAKGGVVADLSEPLPYDAAPGTRIRLSWHLVHPNGDRRPFSALGVFVRLHSISGGQATTAFAHEEPLGSGRYTAEAPIPEDGIGGIQIGLRGSSEIFFPVRATRREHENGPWWMIPTAAVVGLGYAAIVARRSSGGKRSSTQSVSSSLLR
jgi:hypothetical protein